MESIQFLNDKVRLSLRICMEKMIGSFLFCMGENLMENIIGKLILSYERFSEPGL